MDPSALRALLRTSRSAAKAAALPALLAAGGVTAVFLPTDAKAVAPVSFYGCTLTPGVGTDCKADGVQLGDKFLVPRFDLFSRQPALEPGDPARPLDIRWVWQDGDGIADQDFSDDVWNFSVGDTDRIPFNGPVTVTYGYDVYIKDGPLNPLPGVSAPPFAPPGLVCDTTAFGGANNCDFVADSSGWVFDTISLDTDSPSGIGPTRTTKLSAENIIVEEGNEGPPPIFTAIGESFELVNNTGTTVPPTEFTFSADYRKITIADTVFVPAESGIVSVTNTWTQRTKVPGPLPILGAGAAFGMSRRLRRRIKASASA